MLLPYAMLGKCDMQVLRSQHLTVWCIVRDFGLGIFTSNILSNFLKEFFCKMYV